MHGDECWHSSAFGVGTTNQVARALWRHHDDVNTLWWMNALVTNVESVCECNCFAINEVWSNALFVDLLLLGVWGKDHDEVCVLRSISNAQHF